MVNGGNLGVAGYGNVSWAIGHSYADQPVFTPLIYDPSKPAGSRWTRDGLGASTVPRLYHSSATILPDGEPRVTNTLTILSSTLTGLSRFCVCHWIQPESWLYCRWVLNCINSIIDPFKCWEFIFRVRREVSHRVSFLRCWHRECPC